MESVPAYLLAYFLRIRKHSEERGYLVSRMKGKDMASVTDEVAMLRELSDLHLIGLSDKEAEIVFGPLVFEVEPGVTVHRAGTETRVYVPTTFVTLARGRWYWTELVTRAAAWAVTASVGAVLGALCTLWLVGN